MDIIEKNINKITNLDIKKFLNLVNTTFDYMKLNNEKVIKNYIEKEFQNKLLLLIRTYEAILNSPELAFKDDENQFSLIITSFRNLTAENYIKKMNEIENQVYHLIENISILVRKVA